MFIEKLKTIDIIKYCENNNLSYEGGVSLFNGVCLIVHKKNEQDSFKEVYTEYNDFVCTTYYPGKQKELSSNEFTEKWQKFMTKKFGKKYEAQLKKYYCCLNDKNGFEK
jgi:hypothetical protein